MSTEKKPICPTCQQAGKPVDILTLKALLSVPLTELRHPEYLFCATASCSVVYYSADGTQSFRETQLRERVYQKHRDEDEVFVCYCFRHTVGNIKAELAATQQSTVVAAVTAGIQAKQCACEVRNPQGNCCLGNVGAAVKHAQSRRTTT